MAKIIALDIGGKRTGIAETDFLQIVASPLTTVATEDLLDFIIEMKDREDFEAIVVGEPIGLDGADSDNSERVRKWVARLKNQFPGLNIELQDERYSSKLAMGHMIESGMKKKRRRVKGEIDRMSAAVILQAYLQKKAGP